MPQGCLALGKATTIRERIGCDIENPHHMRTGKIENPAATYQPSGGKRFGHLRALSFQAGHPEQAPTHTSCTTMAQRAGQFTPEGAPMRPLWCTPIFTRPIQPLDRKSTRLNSSH